MLPLDARVNWHQLESGDFCLHYHTFGMLQFQSFPQPMSLKMQVAMYQYCSRPVCVWL